MSTKKRTSIGVSAARGARVADLNSGSPETIPDLSEAQSVLAPGLYVTATPIGHARDITLRALDVLRGCDVIAAEDTRVTAKLLAIYRISKPLVSYNDHNAPRERPRLLGQLRAGARIALVSDAGTPLVSIRGYKLVRAAVEEGFRVEAVPGASALLAALTLAAVPADRFLFAGFLPPKAGERRALLATLRPVPALVFYESPRRLAECLADLAVVFGNRPCAIAREMTKLHQEVRRGDLAELSLACAEMPAPKGEITLVVGPPSFDAPEYCAYRCAPCPSACFHARETGLDLVAEALNVSRRAIYARALALRDVARASPDA